MTNPDMIDTTPDAPIKMLNDPASSGRVRGEDEASAGTSARVCEGWRSIGLAKMGTASHFDFEIVVNLNAENT
jgi:hypothetical protein